MLYSIQKDLKDLKGADVSIFGQRVKLNNQTDLVEAVNIIDGLREAGIECNSYMTKKILALYDESNPAVREISCGNSYNWNGNIDHDLQYYHIEYKDSFYIILSFHRFGDIRGNYTAQAVLKVDREAYDFWDVILENDLYNYITVAGVEYSYTVSAMREGIEVDDQNEGFSFTLYCAVEDLEKYITEYITFRDQSNNAFNK